MHYMNLLFVSIGLLGASVVALALIARKLMQRITQLTQGKNGIQLEQVIKENNATLLDLKEKINNQEEKLIALKKDAMNNIQNIGVVRFNPFKETGGSQSFAIALTDKKKNGVIISSLYARERINVFAKPIHNGDSEYTLTEEEKSAIIQSQK